MMKQTIFCLLLYTYAATTYSAESICYGTTAIGYLKDGVSLPASGDNFVSYSYLASQLGRTYVHSTVKNIIVDSYAALAQEFPTRKYKYAETGFKKGGEFSPHKTHRNGLSVDFMVPVINKTGESDYFPTNPLNKFGYAVEFDKTGRYEDYKIDYEAMAAHIVQLHKSAVKSGVDIWRVIFDPALQPYLFKTQYGPYLKEHIKLSTKKSWVRHDEHYHVDFLIPCKPVGKEFNVAHTVKQSLVWSPYSLRHILAPSNQYSSSLLKYVASEARTRQK